MVFAGLEEQGVATGAKLCAFLLGENGVEIVLDMFCAGIKHEHIRAEVWLGGVGEVSEEKKKEG